MTCPPVDIGRSLLLGSCPNTSVNNVSTTRLTNKISISSRTKFIDFTFHESFTRKSAHLRSRLYITRFMLVRVGERVRVGGRTRRRRGAAGARRARGCRAGGRTAHGRPARGARRTGPGGVAAPPRFVALNSHYSQHIIVVALQPPRPHTLSIPSMTRTFRESKKLTRSNTMRSGTAHYQKRELFSRSHFN